MSRIALTPNASGTGTLTIAAPNTNTDRTLTLPDAAGTVVTDSATQTLTNKTIDASQLAGTLPSSTLSTYLDPENRIINGAFDFWQRGTSNTNDAYGSADRWRNGASGGTVTMSRQAFTLGDTLGNNSPTFFLRQTVSGQTLASHLAYAEQRVEGVRSYAGQTITILGWARRSSGAGNFTIELEQNFGTGGSPSSPVTTISPTTVTLTGSWAAFAATIAVPSITGKTLGSNGNDYLRLMLWTSGGSDYNTRTNSLGLQTIGVDLWGIHIKQGTHTTSAVDLYRQPELGPELARCQRYFHRAVADAAFTSFGAGFNGSATQASFAVPFPTQMRIAPALSTSGTASQYCVVHGTTLTPCSSVPALSGGNQVSRNTARVEFVVASGLTAGQGSIGASNSTTSAFLAFDAEL